MIAYYQKTSGQAFKDYRWNLVLARLYDAKNDWSNASAQMQQAIHNQPEMIELHAELAEMAVRAKEFKMAIEALSLCVKRTNDDPAYIRLLADAYDKAGRKREAEITRARLPVEKPKSKTLGEQFAEATRLPRSERAKAIETYRKAFDAFAKDFYKHELRAYELEGYVATLRDEEPLDQIARRLWELRERIRRDAVGSDNLLAGKARVLLETFDRALPESVGKVANEFATGDELAALHRDLQQWIANGGATAEADGTQTMLLNLSYRAGFNDLAERILIARKDSAAKLAPTTTANHESIYRDRLMTLVNFYSERAAYTRIVELIERELAKQPKLNATEYRALIAEYARLTGDGEGELAALRAEFQNTAEKHSATSSLVDRYFEALLERGEAGRAELQQIVAQQTLHRFRLINFLLRNNELQLARAAIQAAPMNAAWHNARRAELSLAARDLNASNESFFTAALGWRTIGEMLSAKPDSTNELIGDNWFALAESYGRWLSLTKAGWQRDSKFLPAMLERKPKDAAEQHRLGQWLLEQKQHAQALEHLQLAIELRGEAHELNKPVWADVGSAYFELGNVRSAHEHWAKILAGKSVSVEDEQLYLQTLSKHRLQADARGQLQPFVIWHLKQVPLNAWQGGGQAEKAFESLKPLIRALAESFEKNDREKAAFFHQLAESVPRDTLLSEMIVREALLPRSQLAPFYELLIKRTSGISNYVSDFDFEDRLKKHPTWSLEEIEEAQDHAVVAQQSDQQPERLSWQKQYLEMLIAERKETDAAQLVSVIEQQFKGRFARPDWLRLARLRLDARAGRLPQAMTGIKRFVGVEVSDKLETVSAPNLERLNQAVEMLRSEQRQTEADELLRAAYERQLAFEQLTEAAFVGLARLAFAKNDSAMGLKLLRLMNHAASSSERSEALAELMALPFVKARAVDSARIETPAAINQLTRLNSLRLAAETAAEFGQFAAAIEYRQSLLELSPEDDVCRLELARLLAANKREAEAAKLLAGLIAERRMARKTRWTAVWIAPEIAGKRDDLWQTLIAYGNQDREAAAALVALSLANRGQAFEAARSLNAAKDLPSNQLKVLRALMLKRAERERDALSDFAAALIPLSESSALAEFRADEDELRWQMTRLYARLGQPRAALKVADVDERLRSLAATADKTAAPTAFQTLFVRAEERQRKSRLELLAMLSASAEQIGEFDKAAGFERARLDALSADERRRAESRIEQLKSKQKEKSNKRGWPLTIDERPVTVR